LHASREDRSLAKQFLAAQVKPQIEQQWATNLALRKLKIENITLQHKAGNDYTGWIEYSLGGHSARMNLDVTVKENARVAWDLDPGKIG
jgi:hypothetical protein